MCTHEISDGLSIFMSLRVVIHSIIIHIVSLFSFIWIQVIRTFVKLSQVVFSSFHVLSFLIMCMFYVNFS